MSQRSHIDQDAYHQRAQTGPCFICELITGNPDYAHHVIYEDDDAIAFLNAYPTLYGYTLVAPKAHKEQVTGDFSPEEYLKLQRLVYRVAESLRQTVPTERVYILSLGSQQGNGHVHWHVAPLPPGVPYENQQVAALSLDNGVLDLSEQEMRSLADRIRDGLPASGVKSFIRAHPIIVAVLIIVAMYLAYVILFSLPGETVITREGGPIDPATFRPITRP